MDIPQWLYDKTDHAGTWYDMEYGKGYAPDYNNEQMIQYHKRAVNALGEHFGRDGLVSYIELGSLGHWGEWHVNISAGIQSLPEESVRERLSKKSFALRFTIFLALFLGIAVFGVYGIGYESSQFIYNQF